MPEKKPEPKKKLVPMKTPGNELRLKYQELHPDLAEFLKPLFFQTKKRIQAVEPSQVVASKYAPPDLYGIESLHGAMKGITFGQIDYEPDQQTGEAIGKFMKNNMLLGNRATHEKQIEAITFFTKNKNVSITIEGGHLVFKPVE